MSEYSCVVCKKKLSSKDIHPHYLEELARAIDLSMFVASFSGNHYITQLAFSPAYALKRNIRTNTNNGISCLKNW